jgi:hypothetical protein
VNRWCAISPGTADAERLGGTARRAFYSPDAFGHPAVLRARDGVRHPVRRVVARHRGRAGPEQDLFRWRAPDGRQIVVYHLPPDGYEVGAALPEGWGALRAVLARRAATPHVAVMVGADHHAAHRTLMSARQAIARSTPDAAVLVSRLDEFLAQASAALTEAPALEGELRWSYGYTWTLRRGGPAQRRLSLAELARTDGGPFAARARSGVGCGPRRARRRCSALS